MTNVSINQDQVKRTVERCRQRGIIIPTFAQQRDPNLIPEKIKLRLKDIGLWDVNSLNLFRINWRNDVNTGGFGDINFIELPSSLTGVKARIFGLIGKYFPTGAHKVGATFGCLAPRLVTGSFDPTQQKAVWPSTGNYCRGGAYNAALLGCESVAILPEEMSQERFTWLKEIGSEVIATPGCESNVKEIYDKCWELKDQRGDKVVILNQFDEFGNGMWHYNVTADAILKVLKKQMKPEDRFAGYCSATGSAGTIAAGDRLKEVFPASKIIASEALQCPTILENGFGAHRIEGIGDKHIPWIHNCRNTDMAIAIDDEDCIQVMRLFNEASGHDYLKANNVPVEIIDQLHLLGISSISNMLSAIKMAKYYELTENDIVFTIFTDSMEMYQSRLEEAHTQHGTYEKHHAYHGHQHHLMGQKTDNLEELTFKARKRVHNLKYYTWIEQQQKDISELNQQWQEYNTYWKKHWQMTDSYDQMINEFNKQTGLLEALENGLPPFDE